MSDHQEQTENKVVEAPTQQEEQDSVTPVAVVEETITFTLILPEPHNEELNNNNNNQEEQQKQQQSPSHAETENSSTSSPEQKQEEQEAILVVEEVTTTTMLPVETSKGEANEEKPRQESERNGVSETEKSPKTNPEQQQTTDAEPQVITEVVVSFIPVVVIVDEVKEEVQQEKKEAAAKAEILPDIKKTEEHVKPAENKEASSSSSSSTAPATYQHEDYSAYSNESASAETVRLHELRKQNTIDRNINDLASSSNEYDHYSELDDKIPREGIIPSKKDRTDASAAAPNSHQKIRSRCTGAVSLSKEALVCEKCAFRKSGYNCVICDKFAPCVYNSSLGSGHKGIQGGLCSRCDKSHCVVCDGKLPVMSWNKQKYAALLCASCGDGGLARRCCKMVEVDDENSFAK